LVGTFPDLSANVFQHVNEKPYDFQNSLALDPHSVSRSVEVFRIEDWDKDPNQCFRFVPGQRYRVGIEYRRIPEDPRQGTIWRITGAGGGESVQKSTLIDSLTIQTTADFISPYGEGKSIGWDFYSLLPGSRSTEAGPVRRGDPKFRYSEVSPCVNNQR
jgi:hypothetical protein